MTESRMRSDHQAGFSLVELLVVTVLLGVIGSIVGAAVISSFRSAVATQTRIEARQELEIALQEMTRTLRGAAGLLVPEAPATVDFLGAQSQTVGTSEERVTYYVIEDVADETRIAQCFGSACYTGTAQRVLVTTIDNDPDDPNQAVFSFLDRDGEPTDGRAGAAMVRIRLLRNLEGRGPVAVETTVAIRSARYQSN